MLALSFFDRIIIKVAGNQDRHKSSDEFDFGPLVSMSHLYVFFFFFFEMRFDLGTLDSGERSLPFGLLVSVVCLKIELIPCFCLCTEASSVILPITWTALCSGVGTAVTVYLLPVKTSLDFKKKTSIRRPAKSLDLGGDYRCFHCFTGSPAFTWKSPAKS